MIPKDSTPVKHKILTDIFAKRLLTLEEVAIVSYIMRWSWGFDNGERRQDWTNKLTKRKMANDIGMAEQHVGRNINKMIKENIIIIKNGCYQFNEHFEEWKNLPKRLVLKNNKKLTESVSKTNRKGKLNSPNQLVKLTEKVSLGMPNNQGKGIKNKDVRGGEHTFKDTLKDNKKTSKDNDDAQKKINKICFNYNKGKFTGITEEYKSELRKQYPNCNIDKQFKRMANWLLDNPNKKRQGKRLFINNWLEKANSDYEKGDRNGKDQRYDTKRGKKDGRKRKDKYKHLEETYEV
ncbi:hypothetical protein ES705_47371 [subsurface metagenome]